jgi:predicted enzyme related to lactoylglutathione lyase
MRTTKFRFALKIFIALAGILLAVVKNALAEGPSLAVGPQYDTTHVYVAPEDFDRFVESLIATFGGTKSQAAVIKITPTPSETKWQAVFTPVGTFSVFGFKSPIPYPFGSERTGYLVSDFDAAIDSAKSNHADIVVAPFQDPIGRDAIIVWPGGVYMQLYWHTTAPHYAELQTVPENRVYVSPDRADAFVSDFTVFANAKVISDDQRAPGIEIGRPNDVYRRVQIDSLFGKVAVLATDGHLPFPYGRDTTGYDVDDLSDTLTKAKAAGASVVVEPYGVIGRRAAMVQFPGGYIAEIHSAKDK